MFYQGIVASVLFFSVLCWSGSISEEDKNRMNTLIRKVGSVVRMCLNSVDITVDKNMRTKIQTVPYSKDHPSIFD